MKLCSLSRIAVVSTITGMLSAGCASSEPPMSQEFSAQSAVYHVDSVNPTTDNVIIRAAATDDPSAICDIVTPPGSERKLDFKGKIEPKDNAKWDGPFQFHSYDPGTEKLKGDCTVERDGRSIRVTYIPLVIPEAPAK